MPTYKYYCSKCDTHFSYFQKMSEPSLSTCEECGEKIERVISGGTGLIFKGSGFYLTDYKDSNEGIDNQKTNKNNKEKIDTKKIKDTNNENKKNREK